MPPPTAGSAQHAVVTLALTFASRWFLLRDRLAGIVPPPLTSPRFPHHDTVSFCRTPLRSGHRLLDAVLAEPTRQPPTATLLLCHGIGETVEHWFGVQRLLAHAGVASLVFDYSGYGRSSGHISIAHCEQDTRTAFTHLQRLLPSLPTSVLGFSLGSGIASAVAGDLPLHRLILCASFTSLRQAAHHSGFPHSLCRAAVPSAWNTEQTLRHLTCPILILHSDADRLFPASMARRLHQASPPHSRLVIVPGLAHDEPYRRPTPAWWQPVLSFLSPPPAPCHHTA